MIRRSPLKRTSCLKQSATARSSAPLQRKEPRPKTCPTRMGGCGSKFVPMRMGQMACMNVACAVAVGKAQARAKAEKAAKVERATDRKAKEAMKTLPQLKKEAQSAFNSFIRARDRLAGYGCICCGAALVHGGVGGGVDAGHWRSVGSAPHLRYHEDNCHAQTTRCNRFGAGRAVDYRAGLVARIGLARVEALEANQTSPKWTRDELRGIRDTYRAKARELEKV